MALRSLRLSEVWLEVIMHKVVVFLRHLRGTLSQERDNNFFILRILHLTHLVKVNFGFSVLSLSANPSCHVLSLSKRLALLRSLRSLHAILIGCMLSFYG